MSRRVVGDTRVAAAGILLMTACGPQSAAPMMIEEGTTGASDASVGTTSSAAEGDSSGEGNVGEGSTSDSSGPRSDSESDSSTGGGGGSSDGGEGFGSTGSQPSGDHTDPMDAPAGADIVLFGAFVTEDAVSLRLTFAGAPLQGGDPEEVAWGHWYLDVDPDREADAPFGAEVVIGIYDFGDPDGAVRVAAHGEVATLCGSVELDGAQGLEIRVPRALFGIEGTFEAAASTLLGDEYDVVPDEGMIESLEVEAFPPWSGASCDTTP